MDTSKLKKFAQSARRSLIEQVGSKLELVIKDESPERRELPQVVAKLEKELDSKGKDQLIEQVAYIWFNRFCALRFMDVNGYNRIGVISPADQQVQPEILAEAKAGHIDDALLNDEARKKIFDLLSGAVKSRDGQAEAYQLLIVAVCNDYHRIMPYLFERIEDYTELLMPDDLLSDNSILETTREAMSQDTCKDVEVIGWLYQFYISEKKDHVFEGLKKKKKITPENIPAATQLFTPHWIVRYLVENSLGRLWILNNPNSKIIERMDYYIKPVEEETDYLKIGSPEDIKICDPACGSGHMLTYAYDLLYAIYLEAGYDPVDIPQLILTKNLYGIEIDERAAELAAFALSMKAVKGNPNDDSNCRRRFFRNPIKPNICRLEKITFTEEELDNYIDFIGKDLFTQDLRVTLKEFEETDNFGSLIQPTLKDIDDVLASLEAKDVSEQLFLTETHTKVLNILKQTDYLSPKYHVVIANPPYMGFKGMNPRLSTWLADNYPDNKSDLFSAFILRTSQLLSLNGLLGIMSPHVWMFLQSHESLRRYIIEKLTLENVVELPLTGFSGATVQIAAFTASKVCDKDIVANFISLLKFSGGEKEMDKRTREAVQNPNCGWYYRASGHEFLDIPGSPIAYLSGKQIRSSFISNKKLAEVAKPRQGMATSDNNRFLRNWHEVSKTRIKYGVESHEEAIESKAKWFPYNKGGPFRKWYGNNYHVINWENDGAELMSFAAQLYGSPTRTIKNIPYYFQEGVTWSDIKTGGFGARINPKGFIFDVKGSCAFPDTENRLKVLGLLSSKLTAAYVAILNPSVTFQVGDIARIPFNHANVDQVVEDLVSLSKEDWDSFETSWDFSMFPLLSSNFCQSSLKASYQLLRSHWRDISKEAQRLEEENNRIFIKAYGLQDELKPEVPLNKITLFCNAYHRYGNDKSEEELESLLLSDTVREFISYSIGCMLGRYSLDEPGLILADQGKTIEDYLKKIANPIFIADDDNVLPLIDFEGDWFEDDVSERFKQFLKITFGEEHFAENLAFIEEAIGKDIKKYFVKDFYTDHVKRYKKRPIYWLFSSPKGTFNALIYMHRYRPDTVSVILNDYLREFRTKMIARKESYEQIEVSASASQKEKTQAIKAIAKINKVIDEVNDYEREILYPLAGQNIEIDLDDGVKHNYPLFGKALKKITGLS